MRSRSRFTLALAGLLVGACQGKADVQSTPQAGNPSGRPEQDASKPSAEASQVSPESPSERAQDDPLGQRFADPAWFRKDLFEGAKAVSVSRSEADEDGFFASHILFELPDGTTTEQCADMVSNEVGPSVPGLERTLESDRIKITGSTDRYRVILMCGEAKGVMRAYVSLEWFA